MSNQWDKLKERLEEPFAAIVLLVLLIPMVFGAYTWLVDDVLPEKWSDAIQDVFSSADEKRERSDVLFKQAAMLKVEADGDLKELEPPTPEYDSEMIDIYQGILAEINDRYRFAEQVATRAAELRRKANSNKSPDNPSQQ